MKDGAKVVLQIAVAPEVETAGFFQLEGIEKFTNILVKGQLEFIEYSLM